MSVKICCDFCGRPMEIKTVETSEGEREYLVNCKTLRVNTRRIFPHLCKECAFKIDEVIRLSKDEWIKEIDISSRNAAINSARREALGTKG